VSSTRRRLLAVLGAVTGIALAAVTLHTRERRYPLPQTTDRLLYLRSGAAAGRLALSFDALAADIYWIRTIQHYGRDYKNRGRASRFELLQPLLDLTTTLDKHFLIAYRFGAIFLAQSPPDGPGRPDQAIALLEKGLKANPDKWQLPYEIAFTHYLYTGDFDAAVVWFRKAAALPGAPEWIAPLAALTADKGGNRDALDAVDQLQDLVRQYRERTGRPAPGWSDLVSAGLLRAVPRDQFKVAFVLDPATGTVRIAPDSPLMPLPPMLRK
jgi:tetratricopeptide (TPR) repeat protein